MIDAIAITVAAPAKVASTSFLFASAMISRSFDIFTSLYVKDWVAKPYYDNGYDKQAKDDWSGNLGKANFAFVFYAVFENAIWYERCDSEDNCKLWNEDTGAAKGVDNKPVAANPGNLGGEEATGDDGETKIVVWVALDKDVARSGEANNITSNN